LRVTVDLGGCPDPVRVTVEGLPAEVAQQPAGEVGGGSRQLSLLLTADHEAVPASFAARLILWAGERRAGGRALEVAAVDPEARPGRFALEGPAALDLKPGEAKPLRVLLRRNGVEGPVVLTLHKAPPGVSGAEVTVPAGASEAVLEVRAGERAAPG